MSGRNGYSSITLVDSLSTSYSKQLSPLFTEYELELRKLVYLIIPRMMTKNWVDTFSEELIANVKKITKNGFKYQQQVWNFKAKLDPIYLFLTWFGIEIAIEYNMLLA